MISRVDAKLIELDMQDLEFGHKFLEVVKFARELENEINKMQEAAKVVNIVSEDPLLKLLAK